jgi:surface protein
MSGTAGMLVALANFNIKNTTTYYPELYRIKMLILNANKFVATSVTCTYTYTATSVPSDLMNILYNLTILFPGIYIYYNRTSGNLVQGNYCTYVSGDFFSPTTSGNTFSIYISQSANASMTATSTPASGTFVFSYLSGNTISTSLSASQAPFITVSGVTINSITTTNTATPATGYTNNIPANTNVTVTVAVTYTSIPTADFGISFNASATSTSAFKTWLVPANYTSGLTLISISNVPLSNAGSQFAGIASTGFAIAPAANPIIRQGTSLANCFNGCTYFNSNISGWDTSNVTSMANCFNGCINYNNNSVALTWNTSKVNDMSSMFYNAKVFNQAITYNAVSQYWNTSAVTTIANIFACTTVGAFANAGVSMLWILTGLPGTLTQTVAGSSIYNWRGGVSATATFAAPLTYTFAPAALTTGPNTAFLA